MISSFLEAFPRLSLDFHPAGFLKGVSKFAGLMFSTFLVGGLTNLVPFLQEHFSSSHDEKVILFTGLVIATIKLVLTWLTTPRVPQAQG